MLNPTLMKTIALAAFWGGGLALSMQSAQALSSSTAQQPTSAAPSAATSTTAINKQEEAPTEEFNLDEITPVSDQEIAQFANALMQIQTIQQSYDSQIASVVETVGLSPQRFYQILTLVRSPQEAEAENIPEVAEAEAESFQQALIQIGAIQQETQTQMQQVIQAEGLDLERFQEIIIVINNDEAIESRVRQMLEESDEQS